nr:cytochrome b/b6 domain-containing protein [Schlegelella koreensis]
MVRVVHVALIAGVALGWATTEWLGAWHEPVGWATLATVAVRIVWGFVGPRTARFAHFVRGARATWRYARLFASGRAPRHVGHNPLGALMVLAFFACIAGLAFTGWLYKTDRFFGDETVEQIHVALAWGFVVLAVLHVAGVLVASWRHRENLVAAMIDGRKRAARSDDVI